MIVTAKLLNYEYLCYNETDYKMNKHIKETKMDSVLRQSNKKWTCAILNRHMADTCQNDDCFRNNKIVLTSEF